MTAHGGHGDISAASRGGTICHAAARAGGGHRCYEHAHARNNPVDTRSHCLTVRGVKRTNVTDPRTAVAYLRVSTEEQHLGPEAQRASITAWAAREGVTVVAWHTDAGVSGAADVADRPALAAALGALRALGAGRLVVAKRDRLARDVYLAAAIDRAVEGLGARVVSADGTANGDTPADAFMRTILDAAAQYERALIRGRTKAALAVKRERGEVSNHAPYGWRDDGAGRLVPNAAEQGVIAHAAELRAKGLTIRAIVAGLAMEGVVTRSGGAPNVRFVHALTTAKAA
jgi:DNA invertase Pin-like site-specific DNA recombinase